MHKVIISVAPIDYADVKSIPPAEELAADICNCCAAGASIVHLHVFDRQGKPTVDTAYFEEIITKVREGCDIIIQGSTGGVGLSLDERSVALEVKGVEMSSLNMGSCNVGDEAYINTPLDIEYWAEKMKKNRIVPDMAVFEPGMFVMVDRVIRKGLIPEPYVFGIPLGFPTALPATPENLIFMVNKLPRNSLWSLIHHHSEDFRLHAAAVAMGGNIRVGFEDSAHLAKNEKASCNADMVAKARDLVQMVGLNVAIPAEAREMIGIGNG